MSLKSLVIAVVVCSLVGVQFLIAAGTPDQLGVTGRENPAAIAAASTSQQMIDGGSPVPSPHDGGSPVPAPHNMAQFSARSLDHASGAANDGGSPVPSPHVDAPLYATHEDGVSIGRDGGSPTPPPQQPGPNGLMA